MVSVRLVQMIALAVLEFKIIAQVVEMVNCSLMVFAVISAQLAILFFSMEIMIYVWVALYNAKFVLLIRMAHFDALLVLLDGFWI